jgi:hypothetical protein
MLDSARDNAIANHKTYGNVEAQHRLFGELRRDDPVHWTKPTDIVHSGPFRNTPTSSRSNASRIWQRRCCAGCRESSSSSARLPRNTKFAARRSKQATVFSSAARRVIATKTPSTVRSNSFPTGHPIGISASASEFMHASAGTSPRPRSWHSSANCRAGLITSNSAATRPGRKPHSWVD